MTSSYKLKQLEEIKNLIDQVKSGDYSGISDQYIGALKATIKHKEIINSHTWKQISYKEYHRVNYGPNFVANRIYPYYSEDTVANCYNVFKFYICSKCNMTGQSDNIDGTGFDTIKPDDWNDAISCNERCMKNILT
jgi:hypothetical protein